MKLAGGQFGMPAPSLLAIGTVVLWATSVVSSPIQESLDTKRNDACSELSYNFLKIQSRSSKIQNAMSWSEHYSFVFLAIFYLKQRKIHV